MKAWVSGGSNPTNELTGWNGLRDKLVSLGAIPDEKSSRSCPTGPRPARSDVEIGDDLPVVCLCQDPRNIAFT